MISRPLPYRLNLRYADGQAAALYGHNHGMEQEGGLSFQDHGNPIRFRTIWVTPLPPEKK